MANGLNKHHILEAIDKLRSRKSRPDAFRIVSYVSKKYEFPKNDIKEYLETLSKDGTVLKVEFKGSFSYRNAANHRSAAVKTISPTTNEETSSTHESISDLVAGALAQLIVEEPDYLDVGISKHELYEHLDTKHKKAITKTYFKEILQKEVKNGNLVKFENGNYCLGYPTGEQNSMSSSVSNVSQNSTDKEKEKSKSPVQSVRKYSTLSRHSSPSSSKHSSRSSSALSERHSSHVTKTSRKIYLKANKKSSKVGRRGVEMDKSEVSPSRESSRRKRFQKIVFDPSDNAKPKRMRQKKQTAVVQPTRIRGPYKKHFKESSSSDDKGSTNKVTPSTSKHSTRSSTAEFKLEVIEPKQEVISEDESDGESAETVNACKICGFNIDFKSNKNLERWTSCQFCSRKAHVTCIEDTEQWTRFKLSKWQCKDCKSCVVCKKNKFSNSDLILCGLCDDAYHITCASNIKKVKLNQKWFCTKCSGVFNDGIKAEKEDFVKIKEEASNKICVKQGSREMTSNECSQRTTPEPEEPKSVEKVESIEQLATSQENDGIDESIPDCSNWSCEEVYSYFLKYVLPEEANVFKDQEIDGRVLLLLTRYDVLSDFKLKLGPALKIYAQVKKLQVRKSDPYLFWP